ncbi:MOSC domain-containing protein [Kribbella sp. HUAS MG21]|jgi:MOSC domain-containing protein YiiM|uniref:MOSC domain-containing protein n=1 Tax=Kribbella sp. HUAS MG21 TaxID=3160966 RepID=A0AAU7TH04_9ACTN
MTSVEIVALVVSPQHAYEGRPADGPRPDLESPARSEVEVRAGLGIVGDRYFGQKVHKNAAVTLMDADALDEVARVLSLPAPLDPHLTRRNIVLRGFPVDELAARRTPDGRRIDGRRFTLDSGQGPVTFQAHRPANPCAWMDVVLAPGAMKALRGRGGIRTTPLTSGVLRLGPAQLTVLE